MSIERTLEFIQENKISLIRFGDGEINLLSGKSIYFQDFDKDIYDDFMKILNSNSERIIIGISDNLNFKTKAPLYTKWHWANHYVVNKDVYVKHFDNKKIYANANFSRPFTNNYDYKKSSNYFESFKEMLSNKSILIVEGKHTRNGLGNDLFKSAKIVKRIICPPYNAYNKISLIEIEVINNYNHDLILVSLGPSAKILIYNLALKGFWALDIGQIDSEYEWFLLKDYKKKTKFNHKHTADIDDKFNIDEVQDSDYLNSVIVEI